MSGGRHGQKFRETLEDTQGGHGSVMSDAHGASVAAWDPFANPGKQSRMNEGAAGPRDFVVFGHPPFARSLPVDGSRDPSMPLTVVVRVPTRVSVGNNR